MSSMLSDEEKLRFARMLADEFRPSGSKNRGGRRLAPAPRPPPPPIAPRPVQQRAGISHPTGNHTIAPARAYATQPSRMADPAHRVQAAEDFLNNTSRPAAAPIRTTPAVQPAPVRVAPVQPAPVRAAVQPGPVLPTPSHQAPIPRSAIQSVHQQATQAFSASRQAVDEKPARSANLTGGPTQQGDDILQQLIRAVPALSGAFNIGTKGITDNGQTGSDFDSDSEMGDDPVSLLERVGILFPVI
ncbi:hypothetical protein B0T11DRAFT_127149 [Plectosphaerella cucumerina]|uniref:Uncharacterized protein n=1 Tax=Plectosphaerella cucumerina TaxID=40658 RepID=A0A8K0T707_9PEZI|nr:hypothetical protein B0T11DRAFT_127149 [Plectosphaerella cucumerina]